MIDGQGIALMDSLIQRELDEKLLFRLSDQELSEYGYFIARHAPMSQQRVLKPLLKG